ncbi:hypothetical protein APED_11335 [Acanthopleuribacter pedis]
MKIDRRLNDLVVAVNHECNPARVKEIVAGGVDVNAATGAGCTALMFAVMPNEYGDHKGPVAGSRAWIRGKGGVTKPSRRRQDRRFRRLCPVSQI